MADVRSPADDAHPPDLHHPRASIDRAVATPPPPGAAPSDAASARDAASHDGDAPSLSATRSPVGNHAQLSSGPGADASKTQVDGVLKSEVSALSFYSAS